MTATTRARLDRLAREHPEWRPWLGVMARALDEAARSAWEVAVPASPPRAVAGEPLLTRVALQLDGALARRWTRALFEAAAAAGGGAPAAPRIDSAAALALLEAAVREDGPRLAALALTHRWPTESFHAVAALSVLPLLQAVGRRWARAVPVSWSRGYCPICGAWPALGEARGVERSRRLRCARCGGDWETERLRCAFCDNRDHARLGLLVEEAGGERRQVETCAVCHGYLKILATLQAGPGIDVLLDDLMSVDLDVAALGKGLTRPPGPGCALGARLDERLGLARRLLARRR